MRHDFTGAERRPVALAGGVQLGARRRYGTRQSQ